MIKKYPDCVNNIYINEDNETLIMTFDKVTSNEDLRVGLKSITIFIFILWHFYKNIFQSCGEFRNGRNRRTKCVHEILF